MCLELEIGFSVFGMENYVKSDGDILSQRKSVVFSSSSTGRSMNLSVGDNFFDDFAIGHAY